MTKPTYCIVCSKVLPEQATPRVRRRHYCSDACRQQAQRYRRDPELRTTLDILKAIGGLPKGEPIPAGWRR